MLPQLKKAEKMQRAFADLKKNFYLCTTIIRERSASDRNYRDGAIAQLVEQRTENPCVPGSIPGGTTLLKRK